MGSANELRWNGRPGHYEVYYLTITDPRTGVGIWIRYTMVAPLPTAENGAEGAGATCSLWFLAMDPRPGARPTVGRKATYGIESLETTRTPFSLGIAGATLTDEGMAGAFEDVSWELRWMPAAWAYEPVHPLLHFAEILPPGCCIGRMLVRNPLVGRVSARHKRRRPKRRVGSHFVANLARDRLHVAWLEGVFLAEKAGEHQAIA